MKSTTILCTAMISASLASWAQTPPVAAAGGQPPAPAARGPSLELALEAAQAALAECGTREQKIGVSVVDSAGVLKVLLASDGASSRGVQSGNNKAVTALTFKQPSSQVGEKIKTDADLAAKVAANPNFNARPGGVLLQVNGEIVGAIGVGGARGSENDEACALTGAKKIQDRLK
ncbi:MAG TPA: heme-binding protein [Steroidobacteraceae bacterium]|nr:heme-binding protein [Steroidobacteraceae bacterium]